MLGHSKAAGKGGEAGLICFRINHALSMWEIYAVEHSVPQHFYLSKRQFASSIFHIIP